MLLPYGSPGKSEEQLVTKDSDMLLPPQTSSFQNEFNSILKIRTFSQYFTFTSPQEMLTENKQCFTFSCYY